jgi:hypothetical protein
MAHYPSIDVKQLLTELKTREDITDKKIADAVLTTEATISRLRRGVTKTTDGNRTIAIANFHAKVFRQK